MSKLDQIPDIKFEKKRDVLIFELLDLIALEAIPAEELAYCVLGEKSGLRFEETDRSRCNTKEARNYQRHEWRIYPLVGLYLAECALAGRTTIFDFSSPDLGWIYKKSTESVVDFRFWTDFACWTPEEAVVLSLGRSPKIVNQKCLDGRNRIKRYPTLTKEFARRKELIARAISVGDLTENIRPHVFVEWAKKHRVDIPAELVSLIECPDYDGPLKFRNMENLGWDEISITLLSGGHIQISARDMTRKVSLGELSLKNKTTNQPNKSFELLAALSGNSRRAVRVNSKLKDIAYELRKSLKTYFGITSNPLSAQGKNYVARFGLIDKRDAADMRAKEKASRRTVTFDEHKLSHRRADSLQGEADSSLGFGPDDDGHSYDEEDDMVDDKASRWIAEHDG